MASLEDFRNEVGTQNGQEVVYCVVCGDSEGETREVPLPDGSTTQQDFPPSGYANASQIGHWKKVGDALCCSVRCALSESGYTEEHDEFHAALDAASPKEVLTEEQVREIAERSLATESNLDELEEFSVQRGEE